MKRVLLVLGLALAGCSCRHVGFDARPVEVKHPTVVVEDGVKYEDLSIGTGAVARAGDEVLIDYTVWLADGAQTRVDSTLDRGVPVRVKIGAAFVDGLNSGLMSIQKDGRRKIFVPARQAYGEVGVEGAIPPNADLEFEVHAIEVKGH